MLDRVLEGSDLTQAYQLLAIVGICLCLYVTQKTWHDEVAMFDPAPMRWARRVALIIVAMVIAWSVVFMEQNSCRPWPPMVLMVAAVDLLFGARASILWWRSLPNHRLSRRLHNILMFSSEPRSSRERSVR